MTTRRALAPRTLEQLAGLLAERRDCALASAQAFFTEAFEAQRTADISDRLDPASPIGTASTESYNLSEHAYAVARDAEDALERIRAGTYGVCTTCGDGIPLARLRALPTATACVACASAPGIGRSYGIDRIPA